MRVVGNIASDSEVVATADGAITAGKPVVVKSDGTVAQTSISGNAAGSQVEFDSGTPGRNIPVFVPSENKIALHSSDGNGVMFMVTISGTTPSFATENVIQASNYGTGEGVGVTICSSNASTLDRVLIAYQDIGNSRYGTAIVYKPSDGTFGSKVVFESAHTQYMAATYDSNSDRVVINYQDRGNSNYGTAVVGAVSGTSVSFGTPVVYNSGTTNYQASTFDSNSNKVVILYQDGGNGEKYTAIVGTVNNSDNSISFGSEVAISAGGARSQTNQNIAFDSNSNKVLVGYRDNTESPQILKLVVGTVSGTSISFGTILDAGITTGVDYIGIAFNPDRNKFGVVFQRANPVRDVAILEATISGTNVTVTSPMSVNSGAATFVSGTNGLGTHIGIAYDTNVDKFLVVFQDGDNDNDGQAHVVTAPFQEANLTSENFIGFAKDNVADGAVATIQTANSIARDNIGEPITLSGGTAAVFESANTTLLASTFDSSNNKIVIAYRDNGNSEYGTAIVGTVSGTDITFGSPTVFESASVGFMGEDSIVFDSNANKVVIVYEDEGNSQYGTAIVGTVSGTSISFGSPTVFESAACFDISAAFDSSNNKVVVAYEDQGNSEHGTAIVGTVSGTSISFGSPTVFNAGETLNIETTFDSTNNKVVIAFTDAGNSNQGTAIVGTVSGTSISFGSEAVFDTSTGSKVGQGKSSITFDSNQNKVLVSYVDVGDSEHGKAIVGTVSGTSISFGTASTFESATTSELSSAFDSDAKVVIIAYKDEGNSSYGTAITASISGTSVSFGTPVAYKTSRADEVSITYDSSNNKTVAAFGDVGNSEYGTAVVISADSSLTIGQTYFVQTDGTLSTSADDPSVIAGTAISGTDLIVKG
jgi:hypothetical protein